MCSYHLQPSSRCKHCITMPGLDSQRSRCLCDSTVCFAITTFSLFVWFVLARAQLSASCRVAAHDARALPSVASATFASQCAGPWTMHHHCLPNAVSATTVQRLAARASMRPRAVLLASASYWHRRCKPYCGGRLPTTGAWQPSYEMEATTPGACVRVFVMQQRFHPCKLPIPWSTQCVHCIITITCRVAAEFTFERSAASIAKPVR